MLITIFREISTVVIRDNNDDRTFIGRLDYHKHKTDIDYIITNLSPIEAILNGNTYKLGKDNQIKIYRLMLKLSVIAN